MQSRSKNHALGIDVSHHQAYIDWKAVKEAGKSFAYIKATEGTTWIDPNFRNHYSEAKKAGLFTGAYHYARPGSNDPIDEADHFVEILKEHDAMQSGDLPPSLDLEEHGEQSRKELSNWAQQWLDRVQERTKLQPVIYAFPCFLETKLNRSLNDTMLWLASYGVNQPKNHKGWHRWTFLQYSDTGSVSGIESPVDLNEFDGTVDDLKHFVEQIIVGKAEH